MKIVAWKRFESEKFKRISYGYIPEMISDFIVRLILYIFYVILSNKYFIRNLLRVGAFCTNARAILCLHGSSIPTKQSRTVFDVCPTPKTEKLNFFYKVYFHESLSILK